MSSATLPGGVGRAPCVPQRCPGAAVENVGHRTGHLLPYGVEGLDLEIVESLDQGVEQLRVAVGHGQHIGGLGAVAAGQVGSRYGGLVGLGVTVGPGRSADVSRYRSVGPGPP